jgi:hypothetical protein
MVGVRYHLAVGNMDEAYKAVKLISNPAVWENMAQICVKSKRLDVAEVRRPPLAVCMCSCMGVGACVVYVGWFVCVFPTVTSPHLGEVRSAAPRAMLPRWVRTANGALSERHRRQFLCRL